MPRYFFHIEDGRSMPDIIGTVLPGVEAAREEAIRLAGSVLKDYQGDLWSGELWYMEVHDEADVALFTLTFSAKEGAAKSSRPGPRNPVPWDGKSGSRNDGGDQKRS